MILQFTGWLNECHQRHKTLFFNPLDLIKAGQGSFSVAIQKPGDLILTHIDGSHQGYNTGNNLAIAVNWANEDWLYHCFAHHIQPSTHHIIYDCHCAGMTVGIPFDIWSSKAHNIHPFKDLHNLDKKTKLKLSSKQDRSAAVTWCFYIFLGVDYFHHTKSISWLEDRKRNK